jgi:phosphatidylglycerol---prolipoprotein diacylglyceryl transferase
MLPVLFSDTPFPLYTFGLLKGIAFVVAYALLARELRRMGYREQVALAITAITFVAGEVGSKLFDLVEHWERFVADPMGEIFSGAGVTIYGGIIAAMIAIYVYARRTGIPFLRIADAAAPAAMAGYAIGRIGCLLSGDGDYGTPSDAPWAMTFPNGTVPTLAEQNPGLADRYRAIFPGEAIPVDIAVHPTPIYESLAAIAIVLLLWNLRTRRLATGSIFALYLLLAGTERLLVETIRLNTRYGGLSQAQWISLGMIAAGALLVWRLRSAPATARSPSAS